jgi:hypothetical protein
MSTYEAHASPEEEIHRDHDGEVIVENEESDDEEVGIDRPLKFRFSWRKLWRFAGHVAEE